MHLYQINHHHTTVYMFTNKNNIVINFFYTGKTFTMQGPLSPPEMKGVIPNSFTHIFDSVKALKLENPSNEYLIHCSFLEIYNEVIR